MDVVEAHGIQVGPLQASPCCHDRLAPGKLDNLRVSQATVQNDQAIDTRAMSKRTRSVSST